MDNFDFEEEVNYFIFLVMNNIQKAKDKKGGKFHTVFNNVNVRLDAQEVLVYTEEKGYAYNLYRKDIENFKFKHDLTRYLALSYIDKLDKYNRKEITFEELAGIEEKKKMPKKVIDLLKQKNNISEQLKLLRSNRHIPEVQQYIDEICEEKYLSDYMRYLIDRYYYNKKNLVRPEKNGLERMHKLLLRWDLYEEE